jgi:rhomboid protease GluP
LNLSPRMRWKFDQIRRKFGGLAGDGSDQPRPQLCPACRTLVGAGATRCHNCGANMRFSMAAASRSLGRLMPEASPVTYAILTVSCALFLISLLLTMREHGFQEGGGGLSALFGFGGISDDVLHSLGASMPLGGFVGYPGNLAQPWRFVTAVFLHASILHIAFNMWFLMDVGPMIEELYGSARYLLIYVVTGVGGYVASSAIGHFSVGGSGALMGLVGVLLAATMGRQSAAAQMMRTRLIYFIIYIAVIGQIMHGVDNWAHGGGLLTGFILGKLMIDRPPATPEERKLANALGWAAALIVVASFAMMILGNIRAS